MPNAKKCADTPANFALPANLENYTEICNFLAGQRWVDGGLQISIVKVKQRKDYQANIMPMHNISVIFAETQLIFPNTIWNTVEI